MPHREISLLDTLAFLRMDKNMKDLLLRLLTDEEGPTAVEYAVMLAMILLAVVGSVRLLGTNLNSSLEDSNTQMVNSFS